MCALMLYLRLFREIHIIRKSILRRDVAQRLTVFCPFAADLFCKCFQKVQPRREARSARCRKPHAVKTHSCVAVFQEFVPLFADRRRKAAFFTVLCPCQPSGKILFYSACKIFTCRNGQSVFVVQIDCFFLFLCFRDILTQNNFGKSLCAFFHRQHFGFDVAFCPHF